MQAIPPIAQPLLDWYYTNRRSLPFREDPTPYHIWVSEIMLQQTRVSAALPYYYRFIEALPDVAALAAANEETLHKLWQGLGYYSRVRNMHKAAQQVVAQHGGELPGSYEALRALPGVGDYTAGAIGSIAFGLPVVAVDGNVLRVFARLYDDDSDVTLPATKRAFTAEVQRQQPPGKAGDYNQALMELGALVCTPGAPGCLACPMTAVCAGYKSGRAPALPVKAPKKPKTTEDYTVVLLRGPEGFLLQQRGTKGLLAGLWQPVLLPGHLSAQQAGEALATLVPGAHIAEALPAANHIFTHKVWQLQAFAACVDGNTPPPAGYVWATPGQIAETYTIPSAFKAYLPYLLQG